MKIKDYIVARVRLPGNFEKESQHTVTLDEGKGIKQILGRVEGSDTLTPQYYNFDRTKCAVEDVRTWLGENKLSIKQETHDENGDLAALIVSPDDNILFGFDDMNVKEEEDEEKKKHLFVEGFFSTSDKDRHGDVITKEFYEYNIKKGYIKQASTVLLDHNPEKVIGKIVKYELKKRTKKVWGLWVRVEISNAEDVKDVRTKIKEGSLNAFSFRWKGVAGGEEPLDPEVPWGPRTVTKGIIIESSIVSLPANPKAAVERWYEKSLPMPPENIIAEAVANGNGGTVRQVAEEAFAELVKMFNDAFAKKPVPENPDGKQEVSTKDSKGEEDSIMDEKVIKSLIAKMTPDMWATLDDEVKAACLKVDAGIEARLDNVKLKAENEALKKKTADDKAKAEADAAAAKKDGDDDGKDGDGKDGDDKTGDGKEGDAGDDTPVTPKDVKQMIADGIKDGLKNALGTTERKTGTDGTNTTMLGSEENAKLVKLLSPASTEGKELSAEETMDRLLGAYFVPGTDKRYRMGLNDMVAKIANGQTLDA